MDDPMPADYEEELFRGNVGWVQVPFVSQKLPLQYSTTIILCSGSSEQLNESFSDHGDNESPKTGAAGRMTRLRARGGVRDRPPIIDDDDEEVFSRQRAPVVTPRKRKVGRKPAAERVEKEKPVVEKVVVDRERDVNSDETSLYFIMRHSKSSITVNTQYAKSH